uniref:RYDR_ITPR domain-containing protein n=1 Tax=Macrostomum lignano TaxID=282301 RepID=A0A1I8FLE0_9PLAT
RSQTQCGPHLHGRRVDNRKIIDRIPKPYVEEYINLLQQSRCYEYLELLSVLCVCTDMSMPTNQNYITQKWLVDNQNSHLVYYTELGQNIGKQPDKVYVSMDNKQTWKLLSKLAQRYATVVGPKDLENELTSRQISQAQSILATKKSLLKIDFSEEGRNSRSIDIITKQLGYLTLRAKYCELITTMFVDVDDNINVLDKIELVFVYADVPKESQMVDSDVRLNTLLTEVLKMLHYLVKFGYFSSSLDVHRLLRPLLSMLDGRNDLPTRSEVFNTEPEFNNEGDLLKEFRATKRFHCAHQARASRDLIDLFFSFQFNSRLRKVFGRIQICSEPTRTTSLAALLEPEYKHDDTTPFVESEIVKDSVDIVSILM